MPFFEHPGQYLPRTLHHRKLDTRRAWLEQLPSQVPSASDNRGDKHNDNARQQTEVQYKTGDVRSGEVKSDRVISDQIRTRQVHVRSGKDKSDQERTKQHTAGSDRPRDEWRQAFYMK